MIGRREFLAIGGAALGSQAMAQPGAARPAHSDTPRDLTGTWTNATYTDLERPKELPRLVLTPAEAEAYEAPRRAQGGMPASKPGEVGQAESEYNERGSGLLRLNGEIRSSLIVDPPDGQIPFLKAVRARLELDLPPPERRPPGLANPEDRPFNERCLISANSTAPLIPGPDTNVFQFVQTPDVLAIAAEKYNDVRIIRLNAAPDARPVPSWRGESVGRWAGPTLVVETFGFGPRLVRRQALVTARTRVTETFTRTAGTAGAGAGVGAIVYGFTVDDPDLYARPWRGEMLFQASAGRMFEYACHEGNYGLPDILTAARRAEGVR
jgi:hypothetical protein